MHLVRSGRGTKSLERPTSTEIRAGNQVDVREYTGTSSGQIYYEPLAPLYLLLLQIERRFQDLRGLLEGSGHETSGSLAVATMFAWDVSKTLRLCTCFALVV
jgi:hypothetical protein